MSNLSKIWMILCFRSGLLSVGLFTTLVWALLCIFPCYNLLFLRHIQTHLSRWVTYILLRLWMRLWTISLQNTIIISLFAGPFPVLCLMIGSVVTRLVPDEGPPVNITGFEGLTRDEQRVLVASSVTFLAGIMQVNHTEHTSFNCRYFHHSVVIISYTETILISPCESMWFKGHLHFKSGDKKGSCKNSY